MINNLDKQKTAKIFKHLRDGKFLSQNSPEKEEKKLFNYLENYYVQIKELFEYFGINLNLRNGYAYFASYDDKEAKIEQIYELLDYLSFFYHFSSLFDVGFKFSIMDLEQKIKDDITLRVKLDKIKTISGDTLRTNIQSLVKKFEKRGFVALEDEYMQKYIVLSSCVYLIDFFNKIEIKE